MEIDGKNVVAGGGDWYETIVTHEAVTIIPVRWPESGWSLVSSKPKWQQC